MSSEKFCTYLTVYKGNKLPPFYIGYTSIAKLNKGYKGSVSSKKYQKIWKSELRNNRNLFKSFILTKHHTREDAKKKETYLQKFFLVHSNPMYINMSIGGETFYCTGPMSQETKDKISIANKGRIFTEEWKNSISIGLKGKLKTDDHIKNASINRTGKATGERNSMASIENREKISKSHFNKYGVDNVFQDEGIKILIKQKHIENLGVDNPMKSPEIQERLKETLVNKYGVDNVQKIRTKLIELEGVVKTGSEWSKTLNIKVSIIGMKAHQKIDGFSYH